MARSAALADGRRPRAADAPSPSDSSSGRGGALRGGRSRGSGGFGAGGDAVGTLRSGSATSRSTARSLAPPRCSSGSPSSRAFAKRATTIPVARTKRGQLSASTSRDPRTAPSRPRSRMRARRRPPAELSSPSMTMSARSRAVNGSRPSFSATTSRSAASVTHAVGAGPSRHASAKDGSARAVLARNPTASTTPRAATRVLGCRAAARSRRIRPTLHQPDRGIPLRAHELFACGGISRADGSVTRDRHAAEVGRPSGAWLTAQLAGAGSRRNRVSGFSRRQITWSMK